MYINKESALDDFIDQFDTTQCKSCDEILDVYNENGEICKSKTLKEMFIENYNHCIDNSNDMSTGTLLKLDRTGKGGVIVDQYLQLHDSYVIDTDNSVEITNRYIQIVNSSDELTSEEKKFVNSALTLASYSTDLWTNL